MKIRATRVTCPDGWRGFVLRRRFTPIYISVGDVLWKKAGQPSVFDGLFFFSGVCGCFVILGDFEQEFGICPMLK